MSIQDFINAFNKGEGFDFISNHATEFSKTDLMYIVRELVYGIETTLEDPDLKSVKYIVTENLELY